MLNNIDVSYFANVSDSFSNKLLEKSYDGEQTTSESERLID